MAAGTDTEAFPQHLAEAALSAMGAIGAADEAADSAESDESPFGDSDGDDEGAQGEDEDDLEGDEGDEGDPELDDEPEDDEDAPRAAQKASKKAAARGSKDAPLKVSDLSDKEYVKVKIDGVEETLSLKELASAGMRQRTFDRRAHELKQLTDKAEKVAEASEQKLQRFQTGLTKTFENPSALKAFMLEHYPDTLDDLVLDHYRTLYEAKTDGSYEHARRERAIARKEKLLEKQLEQENARRRQQHGQTIAEQRRAVLAPALKEATVASGFASPSKQDVLDICDALDIQERRKGALLTQEEATAVATRWLRANRPADEGKTARKPRHRTRPRATVAPDRAQNGRTKKGPVERYDQFGNLNPEWLLG